MILVTGASGRIGANIVRELTQHGYSVRAAVRPGSTRVEKLAPYKPQIVEADLSDRARLATLAQGCQAVVHNGVIFTGEPEKMVAGGLEATAILLESARRAGCERFVFISSTAVYEGSGYRPGDPVREAEATTEITNLYGACKLASEALCSAYWLQHRLPTISLRFPMVTAGAELLSHGFLLETWVERVRSGEGAENPLWRESILNAWEKGQRIAVPLNRDGTAWRRHFCDVRDAARAVRFALETREGFGLAMNIASVPVRYDVAGEALNMFSQWTIAEIPFPNEYRYEFSLSRAAEFLGYQPSIDGPQMILDAWKMRQHQEVAGLIAP
jgi:nucleoside-diphosphate-sugar epimerase